MADFKMHQIEFIFESVHAEDEAIADPITAFAKTRKTNDSLNWILMLKSKKCFIILSAYKCLYCLFTYLNTCLQLSC